MIFFILFILENCTFGFANYIVYSKKNVFYWKIRTIIPSSSYGRIYQARDVRPERDGGKAGVLSDEDTTEHGYGGFRGTDHLPRIGLEQG